MFGWKTKTDTLPRRIMETTGAYDGGINVITKGLVAGTRIATAMGWRQVEAIAVGDMVLTFDNGMQKVKSVERSVAWTDAPWTAEHMWPVRIPVGALGNYVEMTVLAEQGLMIESDAALDQHGDPFAIVPAISLVGMRGITRQAPRKQFEVITLTFETAQVIYAEGNVLIHCPTSKMSLNEMLNGVSEGYNLLSATDAALLTKSMVVEDYHTSNEQVA